MIAFLLSTAFFAGLCGLVCWLTPGEEQDAREIDSQLTIKRRRP